MGVDSYSLDYYLSQIIIVIYKNIWVAEITPNLKFYFDWLKNSPLPSSYVRYLTWHMECSLKVGYHVS